jgi:cytoskeletal protein RodZ
MNQKVIVIVALVSLIVIGVVVWHIFRAKKSDQIKDEKQDKHEHPWKTFQVPQENSYKPETNPTSEQKGENAEENKSKSQPKEKNSEKNSSNKNSSEPKETKNEPEFDTD